MTTEIETLVEATQEQMDLWKAVASEAQTMVRRALQDTGYRQEMRLVIEHPEPHQSEEAALLKLAAKRVIPTLFIYDVVTTIGGRSFLLLTGIRAPTIARAADE